MITYSGVHIHPYQSENREAAAGIPTPMDIAVQMGRISQFGGAIWMPLLTHSILVACLAILRGCNVQTWLWALLHDGHEVVTADIVRPFKCDCMRKEQIEIDRRLQRFFRLDPASIDYQLIKLCDNVAIGIQGRLLGLPGFAELQGAYPVSDSAKDAEWIKQGEEAFEALVNSVYYEGTIYGERSTGVVEFARVLTDAVNGYGTFYNLAYRNFIEEMELAEALPQE